MQKLNIDTFGLKTPISVFYNNLP